MTMSTFRGLLAQVLFYTAQYLCNFVQAILHRITGVTAHRRVIFSEACPSDAKLAEVCRVIGRLPCNGISVRLEDENHFILWHEIFTTVDCVLRPEVLLYMMDDTRAFFVETPKDLDIHNTKAHPFFYMTQQDYCTRVIIIPLSALTALSRKIGEPKCNLAFLLHSARVGSTAVTQAIHSVPGWIVMSESCFIHKHLYTIQHELSISLDDYVRSKQFLDVGEAAIRFMFKDCPDSSNVFYKAFGLLDFCLIPMLSDRFPQLKIITMHRDGLGTCRSHCQAFTDTVAYDLTSIALRYRLANTTTSSLVSRVIFVVTQGFSEDLTDFLSNTKCRDIFLYHYVRWTANALQYLKYSKSASNTISIMFDELQADKERVISKVFTHLDIPMSEIPKALESLKNDSQTGTKLERSYVQKNAGWKYNTDTLRECTVLLQKYNLPDIEQKFRFCPRDGSQH